MSPARKIARRPSEPLVYAVERRLFSRGRAAEIPTLRQAEAEVRRLCEERGVVPPAVVRGQHGGQARYCWPDRKTPDDPGRIRLGGHATWETVWHETAHRLVFALGGGWDGEATRAHHGPVFVEFLAEILEAELPPSYADRFRKAMAGS